MLASSWCNSVVVSALDTGGFLFGEVSSVVGVISIEMWAQVVPLCVPLHISEPVARICQTLFGSQQAFLTSK